MSAPATHPCDACGGTGFEYRDVREHGHAYRIRRSVRYTCPVCLGEGRFSDRMPIADALADAETLQTVGPRIIGAGRVPYTAIEAIRFARAAFRAVPGLREE